MDLELTEEQILIRDTTRDFAAREITPKAAELDKSGRWPAEILARDGGARAAWASPSRRSTAARGWTR